jgi:cell filamentation protein, protein adenylyltransferase
MYEATPDPYCYPGTAILINIPDIRNQADLDRFEAAITAQRGEEPFPAGRLSVRHYQAVHHHLFQDVYPWAGRFRTVRIAKGGSMFCYPEHISAQMQTTFSGLKAQHYLRDLSAPEFARASAKFLAALNAIHPFRDSNGRTQLAFVTMLAQRAGHPLGGHHTICSKLHAKPPGVGT